MPETLPAVKTKENVEVDPAVKSGSVQVMVPLVAPAPGVVQDQPAGTLIDWKIELAGMDSVKTAPVASLGPLLVTVCR